MNDNLLIDTKELGDYRIKIYYDECPECPCVNWDMAGRYLFEYNDQYHDILHRNCNWKDWFSDNNRSIADALQYIAAKYVYQDDMVKYIKDGKLDGTRFVYNRSTHEWELQQRCDWEGSPHRGTWLVSLGINAGNLKIYDYRFEILEQLESDDLIKLIKDCAKDLVIKEWSSIGYSQGDYLDGIAYMDKDRYDKMVGDVGKPWKEHALELMDMEVDEIGMWAWGDVKGFVLEKKVQFTKVYADEKREDEENFEWEEVDSCWGYFMETEDLIKEVMSEHDLKEVA